MHTIQKIKQINTDERGRHWDDMGKIVIPIFSKNVVDKYLESVQ